MVRSNKKKLSRKRTTSKSKKPQKHTKKQNKRLKQPKKTKTRKSKRKTRKLKRKSRKLKGGGIEVSSPLRGKEKVENPLYASEVLREKVLTTEEKQIEAEVESELKELNGNFMFKGNPKGEGLSLYYRFYYKDYNDSNKIYLFLLNNPNDCDIKLREIIIDESYGKKNTHTIIEGNFYYQCIINEDLIDISKNLEDILKILYPNKKIIPYDDYDV